MWQNKRIKVLNLRKHLLKRYIEFTARRITRQNKTWCQPITHSFVIASKIAKFRRKFVWQRIFTRRDSKNHKLWTQPGWIHRGRTKWRFFIRSRVTWWKWKLWETRKVETDRPCSMETIRQDFQLPIPRWGTIPVQTKRTPWFRTGRKTWVFGTKLSRNLGMTLLLSSRPSNPFITTMRSRSTTSSF